MINIWYDITVNLCSIVIMSWCNCSNPGCKEAFRKNKQSSRSLKININELVIKVD